MRKHPTRSEALLWAQLRRGKLGVRFRRQHPMLGFIVDFYCASARLVVEVDGGVHDSYEARRRDAARDAWLARLAGVRVLRISADLVERDVLAAVAWFVQRSSRASPPVGNVEPRRSSLSRPIKAPI